MIMGIRSQTDVRNEMVCQMVMRPMVVNRRSNVLILSRRLCICGDILIFLGAIRVNDIIGRVVGDVMVGSKEHLHKRF